MSADATLWSSEAWTSAPDAYLLVRTREGSAEAFGELWRRHLPAAYAVAGRHRGRSAPEDIVAEAAARVLALIRDGKGPDEHFRAYFLSAVRSVAIDQGRRDLRVVPTEPDDLEVLADPADDPFEGLATDDEGLALVREAFAGLSERDQRVLWHTTVEGAAPRAVAPALGMTANAVSVRAMRARESLRALYLDARAERGLAAADTDECRWTVSHLGALVRGRLPKRQTERAEAHVAGCPHAAAIAADLRAIHDGFPALIVPLALLAGLGTPGFVSVPAVVGLTGGAGAVGSAGFAGFAGVAGGRAPGPGSSGQLAASSSSSPSSSSSAGSGADVAAHMASRVTGLVAGLAVSAGVAGALALPGASLAAPSASAAPAPPARTSAATLGAVPSSRAAAVPGASPRAVGSPGATRPTGLATGTVSASATPSATGTATSSGGAVGDRGSTPSTVGGTPVPPAATSADSSGADPTAPDDTVPGRPTNPPSTPPVPPPTTPPAPSPTPPPTTPAPEPGGVAPTITVRLVAGSDPARISVRVRSEVEGSMTVRISNVSGSGTLTVRNSSWTCTQPTTSAVRCTGGRGQALLEQSGTGAVRTVVVRVTDPVGDTWTQTLRPT